MPRKNCCLFHKKSEILPLPSHIVAEEPFIKKIVITKTLKSLPTFYSHATTPQVTAQVVTTTPPQVTAQAVIYYDQEEIPGMRGSISSLNTVAAKEAAAATPSSTRHT